MPGTSGYLFISEDVVEMRKDCITWKECLAKVKRLREKLNAMVMIDAGVVAPVFMCIEGARLKNLDLQVAASDAANWAKTGLCPLRPTPLAGASSPAKP